MLDARRHGRVVLDPIYGYIPLPEQLSPIIDHPMVQRLRRISQTSMASYVYPSMSGQRFPHSLGAMCLAMQAWRSAASYLRKYGDYIGYYEAIKRNIEHANTDVRNPVKYSDSSELGDDNEGDIDEYQWECLVYNIEMAIGIAALLHDVGHPPYSHILEDLFPYYPRVFGLSDDFNKALKNSKTKPHEFIGQRISTELLDVLKKENSREFSVITDIADYIIIKEKTSVRNWASPLRGMIDSEIDVDRIDYLLRDNSYAGTEYGSIDYDRVLSSVEIHLDKRRNFVVGFGSRARSGAEQILLMRSQTYRWLIFHPRVVASDLALTRSVELLAELTQSALRFTQPITSAGIKTVGALFAEILPNLNYGDKDGEVTSNLGRIEFGTNLQKDLFSSTTSRMTMDMEIRASVDDALVLNWVRNGMLLAENLIDVSFDGGHATIGATRKQLMRLTQLGRVAAFRKKTLHPVWKNFEEYKYVCDSILEEKDDEDVLMLDSILSQWDDKIEACRETGKARIGAEQEHWESEVRKLIGKKESDQRVFAKKTQHRYEVDSVRIVNHFASILVAGSNARSLREHLDSLAPVKGGFWECACYDWEPLKEDRPVYLYKEKTRIPLTRTSPLVQSLGWIDQQRVKLFVYCWDDSDTPDSAKFREDKQKKFIESFAKYILEHYVMYQDLDYDGKLAFTTGS